MVAESPLDVLQKQLDYLHPKHLRVNRFEAELNLTIDILNDIDSQLDEVANVVPENLFDNFRTRAEAIRKLLERNAIHELAEFNFENYQQAEWEKNDSGDEEKVAAVSEAANQSTQDKLSELIDAAEDDLAAARSAIEALLAAARVHI